MKNAEHHPIDATKAALFVMLALVLVTMMIITVFVPDIKKLKIAHMAQERSYIALQQARADHKMQLANLQALREENGRALEMLEAGFDSNRFHRDAVRHFSRFEMSAVKNTVDDRFEISEYNVTAELREPSDFYEFVTFLNGYQNAVELDFPIHISADERFLLDWHFGLRVYKTVPEQSRP